MYIYNIYMYIYMINNIYNKQCMGETTDQFRNRWNNYRDNT